MGMLDQITHGVEKAPALITIYGPDGVGKSTFGAGAPSPIFLGPEDGSKNLNVHRFKAVRKMEDITQAIFELRSKPHKFQTLVIDSLDWIEPLIWDAVCEMDNPKATSIDTALGGYGKGYTAANKLWKSMLDSLKGLRDEKGMNIIMIAHSHVKAFNDPSQVAPYDRYMLKLNDKAAALCREFSECVFFATFEVFTEKEKGSKKAKAYGEAKRVLYTERRPSFDAKNRLGLPFEMELSWDAYANASLSDGDALEIREEMKVLLEKITDETVKKKVSDSLAKLPENADVQTLVKLKNRMKTLAGE